MIQYRAVTVAVVLIAYCLVPPVRAQSPAVILATTTSTRDSGLLDSLLPIFERHSGYKVKVIAVGSGQALEMGRRGDADVVLAHAPDAERAALAAGHFTSRRHVMTNDFVIVGPNADPAGLRGTRDAVAALRRLVAMAEPFVSRGDRSGTHQLELDLWKRLRVDPPGRGAKYFETGQGMGATLQVADERRAYTLTDRATFLVWRDKINLTVMVEGDSLLRNLYHVLEVNPSRSPRVNAAGGRALADFFLSPRARAVIAEFGRERFGETLFAVDTAAVSS